MFLHFLILFGNEGKIFEEFGKMFSPGLSKVIFICPKGHFWRLFLKQMEFVNFSSKFLGNVFVFWAKDFRRGYQTCILRPKEHFEKNCFLKNSKYFHHSQTSSEWRFLEFWRKIFARVVNWFLSVQGKNFGRVFLRKFLLSSDFQRKFFGGVVKNLFYESMGTFWFSWKTWTCSLLIGNFCRREKPPHWGNDFLLVVFYERK